jgi:hypothetical protein
MPSNCNTQLEVRFSSTSFTGKYTRVLYNIYGRKTFKRKVQHPEHWFSAVLKKNTGRDLGRQLSIQQTVLTKGILKSKNCPTKSDKIFQALEKTQVFQ